MDQNHNMLKFEELRPIEKALHRNDDLFSICIEATGAGPLDGCCYATAKALQTVIGGELYTLHGRGQAGKDSTMRDHHVLLKRDNQYWDGDGCQSKKTILDMWPLNEGVFDVELRPFVEGDVIESPRDEQLIARIVDHLNDALENPEERFRPGM